MRAEVPKVLIWVEFKVTTSKLGDTMHQVKLSDEKNQSKSGLGLGNAGNLTKLLNSSKNGLLPKIVNRISVTNGNLMEMKKRKRKSPKQVFRHCHEFGHKCLL